MPKFLSYTNPNLKLKQNNKTQKVQSHPKHKAKHNPTKTNNHTTTQNTKIKENIKTIKYQNIKNQVTKHPKLSKIASKYTNPQSTLKLSKTYKTPKTKKTDN